MSSAKAKVIDRISNISDSMIKKIREKYDIVQKQHPDVFPVSRVSKEEIYMDNN